ncbi:MAG TPA: DnaJ domain-containing protein, partial [Candidatus Saccharimonadales bacterium]|nr:DnaJ domain-containing protein [Candidatus Saccharimonadales bacterium]
RSPALEKERQAVLEWIASTAGADYYRVLGVDRGAGEDAIRRSYYRLAKKFHPDRFRRPGFEELLQDVERMFALTTEAYNTLTDDRTRAEYERELSKSGPGGRKAEADTASQARESYHRAKKHIEAEEYFDAATLLETATRLDASKPEYWILLGTVQEKNPRWRRKAEESYKQAIEITPTASDAYLHLARLYTAGGLTRRAHEMYRQVIQWDPGNEEAQEALSGKEEGSAEGVAGKIRSLFKGSRS